MAEETEKLWGSGIETNDAEGHEFHEALRLRLAGFEHENRAVQWLCLSAPTQTSVRYGPLT